MAWRDARPRRGDARLPATLAALLLATACGGPAAPATVTPTIRPLPTATSSSAGVEATELLRAYIRSGTFSAMTWIDAVEDVRVVGHEAQAFTRLNRAGVADHEAALGVCEAVAAFAFGPSSRGLRLLEATVYAADGQPIARRAGIRDACEATA